MISKNIKSFFSFKAIGIDLGTTKSRMAILSETDEGKLEIIDPNYSISTNALIGTDGYKQIGIDPTNTIFNYKNFIYDISRVIGNSLGHKALQRHIQRVPYEIVELPKESFNISEACFFMHNVHYKSAQVLSWIIKNLKAKAEEIVKEPILYSGISVPSFFNSSQRIAIKNAAELAGLKASLVNAPSACILGYDDKLKETVNENRKVLVINIGHGTMDLSIISVSHGVYNVEFTQGSSSFGGMDFDYAIQDSFWKVLQEKSEGNIADDLSARWKLKILAEKAKLKLSRRKIATIKDYFEEKSGKIFEFQHKISREEFAILTSKELNFLKETIEPMLNKCSDINEIILSGGMTKMPAIKNMIKQYFKKIPISMIKSESIPAIGALINLSTHRKLSSKLVLNDILTLPVGWATKPEFEPDLVAGTVFPATITKEYSNWDIYQRYDETYIYQGNQKINSENSLIWKNKIEIRATKMETKLLILNAIVNKEGIFDAKIFDKGQYHYGTSFSEMRMTEILRMRNEEEIKENIINAKRQGKAYKMISEEPFIFKNAKIEAKWKECSLENENYEEKYWDRYLVYFVYRREVYKEEKDNIDYKHGWFPYGEIYEEH
ncbi:unnamed protein product [Blepharisma stoltei]|uniref:Uncharacterized protein n=1 Tax=Blepharisma stoltei TaxID=1481888 RepID=A0AAU9IKC4_9CILI|nr:unnamed protein product [Blepharisma stoltei]